MNENSRSRWTAAIGCAAITACVSTGGILSERGEGEERCYAVPLATLWPVTDSVVKWVGLVVEQTDSLDHVIVARNYEPEVQDPARMNVGSDAGERVAVFGTADPGGFSRLEVVSRAIFPLDVTPKDWTVPIFRELEARLTRRDPDIRDLCAAPATPPPPTRGRPGSGGGG